MKLKKGGSLYYFSMLTSFFIVCFATYLYLYRLKSVMGYHFGMNIAMLSSGAIGLGVGALLGHAFPNEYTLVTILVTVMAMGIGALFGSLVDYQTVLSGISGGIMAGIMGPMIGVMADFNLVLFCGILVYIIFPLLAFSVRA